MATYEFRLKNISRLGSSNFENLFGLKLFYRTCRIRQNHQSATFLFRRESNSSEPILKKVIHFFAPFLRKFSLLQIKIYQRFSK